MDPRTPVLVGAGQVNLPGDDSPQPAELLAEAAARAGADSGAPALLESLESVRVVRSLSWRYHDMGALVGELVGAKPAHTLATYNGGQTPQALVHRTAADIAAGRADVVLIGGVEAWRARTASGKNGGKPLWPSQPEEGPGPEMFGADLALSNEVEQAVGLAAPVQYYPMFETALRGVLGRSPDEHQQVIAELWAGFSAVAAGNPHAALRQELSAEEIRTPGPANRYIGLPYTKRMNSNNAVNQSAALLMTSLERARRAGVPADRMIFPWAGVEANDTPAVSNREGLAASPAISAAGQMLSSMTGLALDEVELIDVYSCFPSAVQIAVRELGVDAGPGRALTVTGGLTFAGGPWNNYVTHSIATMAGLLRERSGVGLCTANGGLLTKHALGLYSAVPPPAPFRAEALGVVPGQAREVTTGPAGEAVIEAYTVMHDREGRPDRAFVAALLPEGLRAWGASSEPATVEALVEGEWCGVAVGLPGDGTFRLLSGA